MTTLRSCTLGLFTCVALLIGCGDDDGGAAGLAGMAGSSGSSGTGGNAGSSGTGGTAGSSGTGGTAGSSGTGGSGGSGGNDELWEGCPTADDFIGPSTGPATVTATDDAIYCVMFSETDTFQEAQARKLMLRFAPGSYPLGTQSGTNLMLPMCLRHDFDPQYGVVGAGALTYTTGSSGATSDHHYQWSNRVVAEFLWQYVHTRFDINVGTGQTPHITLDGRTNSLDFDNNARFELTFCAEEDQCGYPVRLFDSCTFEDATLHRHTLTLDGGNVTFDLRIGESFASTEPGAFVAASGTWQGQAFDQRNYFKLIYVPSHHHFTRSFIVLFDAPIDGACGLRVSDISPYEEEWGRGTAATVNCDLQDIAAVPIDEHMHSLPQ